MSESLSGTAKDSGPQRRVCESRGDKIPLLFISGREKEREKQRIKVEKNSPDAERH